MSFVPHSTRHNHTNTSVLG